MGTAKSAKPLPRNIKFEVTEKGLDFLGYKTLQKLLGSLGKSSHRPARDAASRHRCRGGAELKTIRVRRHDQPRRQRHAAVRHHARRAHVPLNLEYKDLYVHQQDYRSSCATVVMLDCSHSMILYGEDRFTPAKKVALALAHLIRTQYPGDWLKIVLFHDGAEELPIAKLAIDAGRPVSHEHRRRPQTRPPHPRRAGKGYEADRDGHRRQADRRIYRTVERRLFQLPEIFKRDPGRKTAAV